MKSEKLSEEFSCERVFEEEANSNGPVDEDVVDKDEELESKENGSQSEGRKYQATRFIPN